MTVYDILIIGKNDNPIVDIFFNQAFEIKSMVNFPNEGTVSAANTWTGLIGNDISTIDVPAILFVKKEPTSTGQKLTLVGGFDSPTDIETLKAAYIAALNGEVNLGDSTTGNDGNNQEGSFGFGIGLFGLPKVLWYVLFAFGAYEFTKQINKNNKPSIAKKKVNL